MTFGDQVDLSLNKMLSGLRPKEIDFLVILKVEGKVIESTVDISGINIIKLAELELIKVGWSPKYSQRTFAITTLGKEFIKGE